MPVQNGHGRCRNIEPGPGIFQEITEGQHKQQQLTIGQMDEK
jgi:hypothetical protein